MQKAMIITFRLRDVAVRSTALSRREERGDTRPDPRSYEKLRKDIKEKLTFWTFFSNGQSSEGLNGTAIKKNIQSVSKNMF